MNKIRYFIVLSLFWSCLSLAAQDSSVIEISSLLSQQKYIQALGVIDKKLASNKKNQKLLYFKAISLFHLSQYDLAIDTYQLVIQFHPSFPDAYNNLAAIYAKQGKLNLAKEILEKGINSNKSYALIHNNINNIYLEMARESYVKALQLGVKKHNVELNFANFNSETIALNKKFSVSSSVTTSSTKVSNFNKPIKVTQTTKNSRKVKSNTVVAITNPVTNFGPKKTAPRIARKKVIVKAWNESVISVKDEVITALQGWAAAWSAQDVELYLSFYNKQFLPENGSTRPIWVSQRHSRLLKPRWIEVRLSNFLVKSKSENKAEVLVTQMYRSNSFRDSSKKKFLLKRSDDGWQIINEVNYQE